MGEPDHGSVAVGFQLGVDALPLQPAPQVGEEPQDRLRRRLDVALNHQDLPRVRSGRSLLGLGKLGQPVEPTRPHLLQHAGQRAERRPVGLVKAPGARCAPKAAGTDERA